MRAALCLSFCLAASLAHATEVQKHGLSFEHWVADTFFGGHHPVSAPTPRVRFLTVQNFLPGNKLQFGNTISSTDLNNTSLFQFSNGFTTGTESGFFTITAIPEPSTYVAAIALLALMLWPLRRRLRGKA
jgi:hypothetical protein